MTTGFALLLLEPATSPRSPLARHHAHGLHHERQGATTSVTGDACPAGQRLSDCWRAPRRKRRDALQENLGHDAPPPRPDDQESPYQGERDA